MMRAKNGRLHTRVKSLHPHGILPPCYPESCGRGSHEASDATTYLEIHHLVASSSNFQTGQRVYAAVHRILTT